MENALTTTAFVLAIGLLFAVVGERDYRDAKLAEAQRYAERCLPKANESVIAARMSDGRITCEVRDYVQHRKQPACFKEI
jgi:hypothetical protein